MILIIGSDGMLGHQLFLYLTQHTAAVETISRSELDVFDRSATYITLTSRLYQLPSNSVVFNAIGCIPQKAPPSWTHYYNINAWFPQLLAILCHQYGHRLIHPTTDCVYSGRSDVPYTESDICDVTSDYGRSKWLGEQLYGNVTIIRTSIIGIHGRGSLVDWVRSQHGSTIHGYVDHYWNGITCLEYAKFILWMIETQSFWNGVRHVYSPNVVSKYELVKMIDEMVGSQCNIIPIETEYGVNRVLASTAAELDYTFPSISDQIKELAQFMHAAVN